MRVADLPRSGLLPVPIDAAVLDHLGRLPCVAAPAGFAPDGAWRATWSIHSIHGYADKAVGDAGTLTIERRPRAAGLELAVEQRLALLAGQTQVWRARCTLAAGPLPLLVAYDCAVETAFAGRRADDLCGSCAGTVAAGRWRQEQHGRVLELEQALPLSCDWALLAEAALLEPAAAPQAFAVLDNLAVRKSGQRLLARPDLAQTLPDGTPLRCLVRWGQATLPVETFVTTDGRVPLVTAANKWWALETLEALP